MTRLFINKVVILYAKIVPLWIDNIVLLRIYEKCAFIEIQ